MNSKAGDYSRGILWKREEKQQKGGVAPAVLEGARARERAVAVDAETHVAEPRLDRERSALHDGDAPGAPQDLRSGVVGVEAELGAEPQEVRRDAVEDALGRARIREQPVQV